MDFFAHQDLARRKTKMLLVYFGLAVLGTIAAVYGAFLLIYLKVSAGDFTTFWHPQAFEGCVGGTLFIIFLGWAFKIYELSQGGQSVALMLGGRLSSSAVADADERRLLNVVEEMALASGTPVPPVYILENESAINAFAAGYSSNDAVIAITRGGLKQLNRDELQGVIAHEFSHILNGDMRLNIRLISLAAGILGLSTVGYWIVRGLGNSRSSNSDSGKGKGGLGALIFLGFALLVIGWIGHFFASLIKAAVSREREFLADASAVQFTRNPEGIGGALKKIGQFSLGSQIKNEHAGEASHMFFANGLVSFWTSLLATHPPLTERIARIYGTTAEEIVGPRGAAPSTDEETGLVSALASAPSTGQVGQPRLEHLQYAADLQKQFPSPVLAAVHEPFGACALVYALLLNGEDAPRREQLTYLEANTWEGLAAETQKLATALASTPPEQKLPLLDLSLTALRQLSSEQYDHFGEVLQYLIEADGQVDLFEWTLQKVLLRHLSAHFAPQSPPSKLERSAAALLPQAQVLLSALAHLGAKAPETATPAFQAGVAALAWPRLRLSLLPADQCSFPQVDQALDAFSQATPTLKKNLLHACTAVITADATATISETEILRAFADTLDCPMPPVLI
jgi:Zn-dependent protease with chaperone function